MAKQKYCETLQPGFYLIKETNQFTADEIVDNVYNREEIYKLLKKEFEG